MRLHSYLTYGSSCTVQNPLSQALTVKQSSLQEAVHKRASAFTTTWELRTPRPLLEEKPRQPSATSHREANGVH